MYEYGREQARICEENLKEIEHWEDLDVDGKIILKWILKTWVGVCIGFICLRLGTSGGLL
jgi:hypothetical protein